MQYVRNISDSVSTAWNSINPSTLSGAIDVIVVEQEDGSLSCSPFHVRFGKFSLLRPYEKKVEFKVNGVKQEYSMKLGEGGEAFFVFETSDTIPQSLQTSPLVSPASSPPLSAEYDDPDALQEPDLLQLDDPSPHARSSPRSFSGTGGRPGPAPVPGLLPLRSDMMKYINAELGRTHCASPDVSSAKQWTATFTRSPARSIPTTFSQRQYPSV